MIIRYRIKINEGYYRGETIEFTTTLEDIEIDGLDLTIIRKKFLKSTCNDNEYEVLSRTIISK